jgi:hypothetical protein
MHQNDSRVVCELPDQPTKEGSKVQAYRSRHPDEDGALPMLPGE